MPVGTIAELSTAYADGAASVRDALADLLRRIRDRGDDGVWIDRVSAEELLAAGERLDRLAARNPRAAAGLPLFGIPFAVKGNIDVAGLPTTAGCRAFAYRPAVDAAAVRRLRYAGAVLIGTTTLDQFATGLVGTRSPYGVPENAVLPGLVPGGSSSGSAVAVAAGVVPFALGTDTAGSGRVPAALNGVVGLKPTRGLVSTAGVVPACRSLDCVSVFSQTVDDARRVFEVIAGPEPDDPWSRTPTAPARPSVALADLRVAWPDIDDLDFFGDEAMRRAHLRTRDVVAARCASLTVVPSAPLLEAGTLLYQGPWVAERLADLREALATCADDVLPITRAIIESGASFTAVDVFRAQHRLAELAAQLRRWWEVADVLLLPTVGTTFTVAQVAAEPVAHNAALGRYTQFTNLLDLAGLALPAGTTDDGRPVGISLFGPAFSDQLLLDTGCEVLGEHARAHPDRRRQRRRDRGRSRQAPVRRVPQRRAGRARVPPAGDDVHGR